MKWNIKQPNQQFKIELPDSIIDNMPFTARINGRQVEAIWSRHDSVLHIQTDQSSKHQATLRLRTSKINRYKGESESEVNFEFTGAGNAGMSFFQANLEIDVPGQLNRSSAQTHKSATLRSPMAGKVLKVFVTEGQAVEKNDPLLIIEAMKMENKIFATSAGTITDLKAMEGKNVGVGEQLLQIK